VPSSQDIRLVSTVTIRVRTGKSNQTYGTPPQPMHQFQPPTQGLTLPGAIKKGTDSWEEVIGYPEPIHPDRL